MQKCSRYWTAQLLCLELRLPHTARLKTRRGRMQKCSRYYLLCLEPRLPHTARGMESLMQSQNEHVFNAQGLFNWVVFGSLGSIVPKVPWRFFFPHNKLPNAVCYITFPFFKKKILEALACHARIRVDTHAESTLTRNEAARAVPGCAYRALLGPLVRHQPFARTGNRTLVGGLPTTATYHRTGCPFAISPLFPKLITTIHCSNFIRKRVL